MREARKPGQASLVVAARNTQRSSLTPDAGSYAATTMWCSLLLFSACFPISLQHSLSFPDTIL